MRYFTQIAKFVLPFALGFALGTILNVAKDSKTESEIYGNTLYWVCVGKVLHEAKRRKKYNIDHRLVIEICRPCLKKPRACLLKRKIRRQ